MARYTYPAKFGYEPIVVQKFYATSIQYSK